MEKPKFDDLVNYLKSLTDKISAIQSKSKTINLYFDSLDKKYRYIDKCGFEVLRMTEEKTEKLFGTRKPVIELIHIEPSENARTIKPHVHKHAMVVQTILGTQHGFPKPDGVVISGFNIPNVKAKLQPAQLIAGFNLYFNPGIIHGFSVNKETWILGVHFPSIDDLNDFQSIENYEIVDGEDELSKSLISRYL
jgi:hypothetical protein